MSHSKRQLLVMLVFAIIATNAATAMPVTKSQALQQARAFAQNRGLAAPEQVRFLFQENTLAGRRGAPTHTPAYYVFGLGDDKGFVIAAGDDCAYPILGYADRGSLISGQLPDNLRYWLDTYAEEMAWAQTLATNGNDTQTTGYPEASHHVVSPLVPTQWSQNEPFNQSCPSFDGYHSLTGCVATSMAQIMYYYRWPQGTTRKIPSYTSEINISGHGVFKTTVAALPTTTFDWDEMQPLYDGSTTARQDDAVARLMQYCGASVKMSYSPYGSGAHISDAISAFGKYFGYEGTITELERDGCQPGAWEELIYHEISNGRPVILSGGAKNGFHAFVCDGYDGDHLFHINWGWGGSGDGYFRLQALNPTTGGSGQNSQYTGFTSQQTALVGISPTATPDDIDFSLGLDDRCVECMSLTASGPETATYNKLEGLSSLTITHEYKKHSITSETYDIGIGIYKNGTPVSLQVIVKNKTLGCYHWTTTKNLKGLGTKLSDGTYQLVAISRKSGTSVLYKDVYAEYNYVDFTIADGQVTYHNVSKTYIPDVEVTDVQQRFDLESSSPKQVRISLRNNGQEEYIGPIYLFIDNEKNVSEQLCLGGGTDDYVDMFFTQGSGNCRVVVSTDEERNNILYDGTLMLTNYSQQTQNARLTVSDWRLRSTDDEKMEMYGRDFLGEITLTNNTANDFAGNIRLRILAYEIRDGENDSYSYLNKQVPATIAAGKSRTLRLDYKEIPAEVKEIYFQVFNGSTKIKDGGYYTLREGYPVWNGQGELSYSPLAEAVQVPDDVVAADFSKTACLSILPNSNPNTIYYFSHTQAPPATLEGRNVVRKESCDTLTLTFGHDYFVPRPFRASFARYSRRFTLGADGEKGWSTIVLPFGVDEVLEEVSGDTLDWFRFRGDTGKRFWLREYAGVTDDGHTVFVNAEKWSANVPYIIAVPGSRWGKWSLVGKPLLFVGHKVGVRSTTQPVSRSATREFVGVTGKTHLSDGYSLNPQGSDFERYENTDIDAGNAFFRVRGER